MNSASNINNLPNLYNDEPMGESPIYQIYNSQLDLKKTIETNFCFQIINVKRLNTLNATQSSQETNKNQDVYSLTLSDEQYFYNGFILLCDKNSGDINNFDIIIVKSLSLVTIRERQKLFAIKNFSIVGNAKSLLGNPENILLIPNSNAEENLTKIYYQPGSNNLSNFNANLTNDNSYRGNNISLNINNRNFSSNQNYEIYPNEIDENSNINNINPNNVKNSLLNQQESNQGRLFFMIINSSLGLIKVKF